MSSFFAIRSTCAAVAFHAATSLATAGTTSAAEPDWPSEPYAYTVVEQELPEVLETFGANIGVPVTVSPAVTGVVRGRLPLLPPRAFLENLARTYGLTWYYDGLTLFISSQKETTGELMPLGRVRAEDLLAELDELSIRDERYPIRRSDDSNILRVTGPPPYVALVRQTLETMQQKQEGEVRIFRGSAGG